MMRMGFDHRRLGYLGMVGGVLGLALAPIMVIIKYMTGWSVVPEPFWVETVRSALGMMLQFTTPPRLWTTYGSVYTLALLLILGGLLGLVGCVTKARGRMPSKGLWLVLIGLCMVIPGDAIHSWTWHQGGLTIPTPGTNPLANTAYAVHMMGMNLIMVGSVWVGSAALRRRFFAPWLAWSFLLIFPSALLASVSMLPTTPSGALWLFSIMVMACGYFLATDQKDRLMPPEEQLRSAA